MIPKNDIDQDNNAFAYYKGKSGETYFQQQDPGGRFAALVNKHLFAPHLNHDMDLLDYGCGGGHLLNVLNAKTKQGVEINPAAMSVARNSGLRVASTLQDIEPESISLVITCHALEHVASPFNELKAIHKVLRPEGKLVWLSPLDDWRNQGQRTWKENNYDMHLYAWTPMTMGNLLATAGFRITSVEIIRHVIPPKCGRLLWRLSPSLFHIAAFFASVGLRRRQLRAVALKHS